MNKDKTNNNNQTIDDMVNFIDNFMKENGGHLNIKVNDKEEIENDEIYIENNPDCINGACKAPTLFEGLDQKEEEQ